MSCQTTTVQTSAGLFSVRYDLRESDRWTVREIVESTGFFHPPEVDVAVELVDERLHRGDASGYHFAFAERDGVVDGYCCFGPIACTVGSFDIYWVAVRRSHQGHGLGRALMELAESLIAGQGGRLICVETSGRDDYLPTRRFYERCGYERAAELPDFYACGDSKVIYLKRLE